MFKALLRWLCDGCPAVVDREGRGLPPGWRWGRPVAYDKAHSRLEHRCDRCLAAMTDAERAAWHVGGTL